MKQRSAKEYLLISWLVPMLCTIVGSSVLALGLSFLDYSNYRRSEQERLSDLAPIVGRRIVAELLLGEQGTLGPVVDQLKSEYSLKTLEVHSGSPSNSGASIFAQWKLPLGSEEKYATMERESRTYLSFVQLRHFWLALLPTLLMAAFGFLLQRRYLRLHFIEPIEALAETSVGERGTDPKWPTEIQSIAKRLAEAFSSREQAVFGQVARGIIHDIRTHLNSMGTATQLVAAAKDVDVREARLEKLYSACSRNIPKIKSIVDLSLDSSREISMNAELADIGETVAQALATLSEMAQARGVSLEFDPNGALLAVHDPVQLERVFVNLVKNGIEATEDAIQRKHVRIAVRTLADGVAIEVEDSGRGLSNSQSVFRALKSSKTHGVGLGLFVSKKIVEAHNGTLEPGSSTALGGAKLRVLFPQENRR